MFIPSLLVVMVQHELRLIGGSRLGPHADGSVFVAYPDDRATEAVPSDERYTSHNGERWDRGATETIEEAMPDWDARRSFASFERHHPHSIDRVTAPIGKDGAAAGTIEWTPSRCRGTKVSMIARFEELDWQETRMGELTLRRRADPATGESIYEVKLNDEYLMSSLFTVAEEELARLGLAAAEGVDLDVLVGGLGLGHTAVTVLHDDRVRRLDVIDALPEVIGWHKRDLLPMSAQLVTDTRATLVLDDFFAVVRRPPQPEDVRYDVILLDVDHSPRHTLDPSHADLYTSSGLESLARHLRDRGVFALWSDDPPDADFMTALSSVFDDSSAHVVAFDNRLTGGTSSNTVYVANLH